MNTMVVQQSQPALRLAALAGAVGPLVFVALVLVGGVLYDGYSHVHQAISELGGEGSRYAWLQQLNFVLMGSSVVALAWALARSFGPPALGFMLLAGFGISAGILQAVFPCDLGCRGATTVGLLHNLFGMTGFVAAIVSMFVLARRWDRMAGWRDHARLTRIAAYVALAGLLGFIAVAVLGIGGAPGLMQRVFVTPLLSWFVATALRLHAALAEGESLDRASARAAQRSYQRGDLE